MAKTMNMGSPNPLVWGLLALGAVMLFTQRRASAAGTTPQTSSGVQRMYLSPGGAMQANAKTSPPVAAMVSVGQTVLGGLSKLLQPSVAAAVDQTAAETARLLRYEAEAVADSSPVQYQSEAETQRLYAYEAEAASVNTEDQSQAEWERLLEYAQ